MTDPRQIIRERAAELGLTLSALSIMAGRNLAYMQQYLERGSPRRLPRDARRLIAMALDVDETMLGARPTEMPAVDAAGHGAGA